MTPHVSLLAPLFILLAIAPLAAQSQSQAPTSSPSPPPAPATAVRDNTLPDFSPEPTPTPSPAPQTYLGRTIAQTMHWQGASWLVRHKRDREEAAIRMREELRIRPGMTVCDMGSGNGYHTLPIAEAVGEKGKVFAVDIQPEMLAMLKKRAEAQKLTHIEYLLGTETDPGLPAQSCDMILLVDVYHEFAYPQEMLAAMRQALKPNGQLVLVEFRAEDDSVPIKVEHKMSKEQINKEMTANGFQLTRSFDELPWQHLLFYTLASPPAATLAPAPTSETAK